MPRPRPLALAVAAALAALPGAAPAVADDFKVVVHPDNPASELDREALSRLFLKKSLRWPDGVAVEPVEPSALRLREAFAGQIHRKRLGAVRSYWTQVIFSGRDVPPLERAGDAEVLAYVRATRGAVGYVSASADAAGVKVLTVRR
jgi:ABC-type phosphate transport system substrate-binding protein